MTEVIIISAIANNNTIGLNGRIPWHISDDFKRFKSLTLNHPIIMGRKTYESLPIKPLPKRENIILTRNKDFTAENITIKNSFEEALEHCKDKEKVFIIGGSSIYEEGLKYANKLEITKINKDFEGDTFFPNINLKKWRLVNEEKHQDEKIGEYSFQTYEKNE